MRVGIVGYSEQKFDIEKASKSLRYAALKADAPRSKTSLPATEKGGVSL
jgi:hypothetical protein